jgi:hypothetical protein
MKPIKQLLPSMSRSWTAGESRSTWRTLALRAEEEEEDQEASLVVVNMAAAAVGTAEATLVVAAADTTVEAMVEVEAMVLKVEVGIAVLVTVVIISNLALAMEATTDRLTSLCRALYFLSLLSESLLRVPIVHSLTPRH